MKAITKNKILIAVALVVLVGIAVFSMRRQKTSTTQYFTMPVESGPLRTVVNATGTIQNVVTVQVGSQVSGQVEELYADFNSVVSRGQLLAKLDPRNFQAQVENAEASVAAARARVRSGEAEQQTQAANFQSARANLQAARVTRDNAAILFDRSSELSKNGVASRNDYDNAKANSDSARARFEQAQAAIAQAEAQANASAAQLDQVQAQLQQAEADLARAKLNLEYCNIYSPVNGVVISRSIDVGQTIAASLQSPTLFTIANDLKRIQVNANIDEADIGNISDNVDVRFTVDAYPSETFRGRISEIRLNPQTVQNVVTYSVILGIDNPDTKLKPGMTANISITVDQRDKALRIANAALRYRPPGATVPEVRPDGLPSSTIGVQAEDEVHAQKSAVTPVQLAPGQKWDPSQKIRFATPRRVLPRPAIVYVLDKERKPYSKTVVLGITDGSFSEIVRGEINPGDAVIIGDSTQAAQNSTSMLPPPPFLGPPGGGPGFGPRGGGGGRGN